MKVNNFDVLKKMSADNLDIRLFPDMIGSQETKNGTQITYGAPGKLTAPLFTGELVGCLLVWNKKQFEETKKAMENQS